jgi:hypothetical protein
LGLGTAKAATKVLEIVRREAIGAGGSRNCSGCSVAPPAGRARGSHGVPWSQGARVPRPPGASHALSPRASQRRFPRRSTGIGVPVKGPGGPASQPCPAGATRCACRRDQGSRNTAHAREGEVSVLPWRARARGSGTDARARRPSSVRRASISGGLVMLAATVLIDPSWV